MKDDFSNIYEDAERANAYAALEFPGTYYLAYRDLPSILSEHVQGTKALDFGCGTGRSTRFLRKLGYDAVGVDIAEHMVTKARERDPDGEYHVVADGALDQFSADAYSLVLSVFTFDNIATMTRRVALFQALGRLIMPGTGRIVSLVSAPEIYTNEWASFTTKDFPGNRSAKTGDKVQIVMLDVDDRRPVDDIFWTDEAYHEVYRRADLVPLRTYRPLGNETDPCDWVSEATISPWATYVLARAATS
jgi:SAM-dependent methyltransferase